MAKQNFQQPLLQSSVSHDASDNNVICKKTFLFFFLLLLLLLSMLSNIPHLNIVQNNSELFEPKDQNNIIYLK